MKRVLPAAAGLALVLILGVVFHADGAFFRLSTHADALWQNAPYGVLACGLTVVIITGGIDLAVGSLVALCGVVFALLTMRAGWGGWTAIPAAVLAGAAAGAVSGSLVGYVRVQPFIATLAMMAFARGLAKWLSGGVKVTKHPPPDVVEAINARVALGPVTVAVPVIVLGACAAVVLGVLRLTALGTRWYAIGGNAEAARYAGVPVRACTLAAYVLCGGLAGVAGVLFAALERQGNPDGGIGYELTAIAMVVVGGTPLSGGRGGIIQTLLGILMIGYVRKILDINSVDTPQQLMITGAIIVLAVLAQGVRRRG